jgi:hypothetical protein
MRTAGRAEFHGKVYQEKHAAEPRPAADAFTRARLPPAYGGGD